MPTILLKYKKPFTVSLGGGEQAAVAESIRIKINDEKLQAELINELKQNGSPFLTENEPAFGVGAAAIQLDIKRNDPGFLNIHIHKNFLSKESWEVENSLIVVRKFLAKHSLNFEVIRDKDNQVNAYFAKILDNASFPKMNSNDVKHESSLAKGSALFALSVAANSSGVAAAPVVKKTP